MPKLLVGNKEIDYTVKRGSDSKYVHLKFKRNFELEITLPKNSSLDPRTIIRKKWPWIDRKYRRLSERKQVFDGNQVLYKGRYYGLEISRSDKPNVKMENDKIILSTPKRFSPTTLLKDWMTRKTKEHLKRKILIYARTLAVAVNGFKVKDTKRWGYCNRKGELTFNWQLIALPRKLAEYVVLHEIAHLSEFTHSKNFRYKLASLCPDFAEREAMLKNIVPITS